MIINMLSVPQGQINSLCAQLEGSSPEAGEITINGLFYEWVDFNEIVCDLVGEVSSVPTLSQWGLIIMASTLGLIGFVAFRRRQKLAL